MSESQPLELSGKDVAEGAGRWRPDGGMETPWLSCYPMRRRQGGAESASGLHGYHGRPRGLDATLNIDAPTVTQIICVIRTIFETRVSG